MPVVRPVRPQKLTRTLTLREFAERRNKILIMRAVGGLGDILMHRMIFEDFKNLAPGLEIYFACPKLYHDAVIDHPYLTQVMDWTTVNRKEFPVAYNTSTACGKYEGAIAPLSGLHRSDIWARHCGVELKNHQMHIRLTDAEKNQGRQIIEKHRDRQGPIVIVAPISAMESKDLLPHQLLGLMEGLRERGCCPISLHSSTPPSLAKTDFPSIEWLPIRQWMAVIDQCDYVVSVDSAAAHCAGGLGKPLVGIFTWASGVTYTKWYEKVEIVQKSAIKQNDLNWQCPCYNWLKCPLSNKRIKPCLTELTSQEILIKFDLLISKFPCNK